MSNEKEPNSRRRNSRARTSASSKAERARIARDRHREALQSAVAALRSEESFRTWMNAIAQFHNYSITNVLLIISQRPDATRVAGFHTWLKLGYAVRKGEKGLMILCPRPFRVKDEDEDTGEETERRRVSFGTGHVFDISQVDPIEGKSTPLAPPECALASTIEGDEHADLIAPLERLAAELGYRIVRRPMSAHEGLGHCIPALRVIGVAAGQSANAEVHVLVHELAHALGISYCKYGRKRAEAIVEAATYVVLARLGFDVSGYAVPYITTWAADAAEVIERDAHEIERVARRIEEAITTNAVDSASQAEPLAA